MAIYSVFYANLCNALSGILGGILFKTGMDKVVLHRQITFFFDVGAGKGSGNLTLEFPCYKLPRIWGLLIGYDEAKRSVNPLCRM